MGRPLKRCILCATGSLLLTLFVLLFASRDAVRAETDAEAGPAVVERGAGKVPDAGRIEVGASAAGRVPIPSGDGRWLGNAARMLSSRTSPEFRVVLNQEASRGVVADHIRREAPMYDILRAAAAAWPASHALDVGANHGCYTMYAAALGLSVVAVELQVELARLVALSAAINGFGDRVTVLHRAAMDGGERPVGVREGWRGDDGAIAVPLEGAAGGTTSLRLDDAPIGDGPISFLKIDVEGYEITALRSARALFRARRVKNVIIEFGPPERWARAGSTPADAEEVLRTARDEYGFDVRVVRSFCYNALRSALPEGSERVDGASRVTYLDVSGRREATLLSTMRDECYVWLHLSEN